MQRHCQQSAKKDIANNLGVNYHYFHYRLHQSHYQFSRLLHFDLIQSVCPLDNLYERFSNQAEVAGRKIHSAIF